MEDGGRKGEERWEGRMKSGKMNYGGIKEGK